MDRYEIHPQVEELLLYLDGELPRKSRAAIPRHLKTCWKCRAELAEFELAISEFILDKADQDAARGAISQCSPAELRRKLEAMDREMELPQLTTRIRQWFGLMPRTGRFSAGLLAAAGVGFGLVVAHHFISQTPEQHRAPAAAKPSIPVIPEAPHAALLPAPSTRPASAPQIADAGPKIEAPGNASAEVAAWSKLHKLGADLGEPVEVVAAANSSVTVTLQPMDREREEEIRAALAGVPGVTVRAKETLQEEAKSRAWLPAQARANAAEPVLVAAFGGRPAFDRLANEVLEGEDAILSRAQALRVIEDHFPATRVAALSEPDRGEIERMVSDHRRAARESARRITGSIAQAASALGGARPDRLSSQAGLLAAAQRLDHIVSIVFGGSPSDLPARQLGTELAAALSELTASLEALP